MASPYGAYGGPNANKTPDKKNAELPASSVFRNWSPAPTIKDGELAKLDQQTEKTRRQLHELREHGRQIRLHRLQALDALETRRVTLTEILRRMEKELNDRDVYEYGDILAEVFGERKIFAHRAVGLEALLCQVRNENQAVQSLYCFLWQLSVSHRCKIPQYMHQMLAKQHQLKIMNQAGKDIQSHYKKNRLQNKDDFYSYEALAVQCEASRLSLEAVYDDVIAAQHRALAKLKHVESGGNMTNYSAPGPKPTTDDKDDLAKAMDVLKSPSGEEVLQVSGQMKKLTTETPGSTRRLLAEATNNSNPAFRINAAMKTSKRSSDGGKSARERRREIEQKRLARPSSQRPLPSGPGSPQRGRNQREHVRELEARAKAVTTSPTASSGYDSGDELKERRSASRKVVTSA